MNEHLQVMGKRKTGTAVFAVVMGAIFLILAVVFLIASGSAGADDLIMFVILGVIFMMGAIALTVIAIITFVSKKNLIVYDPAQKQFIIYAKRVGDSGKQECVIPLNVIHGIDNIKPDGSTQASGFAAGFFFGAIGAAIHGAANADKLKIAVKFRTSIGEFDVINVAKQDAVCQTLWQVMNEYVAEYAQQASLYQQPQVVQPQAAQDPQQPPPPQQL